MKLLKTSDELIQHMKEKGIKFNIVNENAAKEFLQNNNYYMKLASYRENYNKNNRGEYVNLEFAYLQEISTIDMHFRYIVLQMCLDIEHSLKIILLNDIENNPEEDGYDIIRRFITKYERCIKNIQIHQSSEYCKDLIEKYYPYFPVWVFVELISFGDLVKLIEFYSHRYPGRLKNSELLYSVRDLRNASAHSNCLLNKLKKGNTKPSVKIVKYVSNNKAIGYTMRSNKLSNKLLCDFTTLMYAYDYFVKSKDLKQKRLSQLQILINERCVRNADYFRNNTCLSGAYTFVKNIIDYELTVL